MSEFRCISLEAGADGVRTLSLRKAPVNALGRELVGELERALEALALDEQARCLVLRSDLKHFCAGADLKERRTMSDSEVLAFVPRLGGICLSIADLPYPTVAAVRGVAAGGGCELALACDIRILAEDVKIGLRETALAIVPGAGGTQRLPRLIGPERAKHWIFTAAMHSATEALRDGVASRVVSPDDLDREVAELAATIASNGPVAIRLAKKAIDEGAGLPMSVALEFEWECYQGVLDTEDRLEALDAFANKRPPRFEGR